MSRVAPTPGSKVLYFLCITISGFLIYTDLQYKSFERIKFFYQSLSISSSYILRNITIEPLKYIYKISKDKNELINENKRLKQELDNSYISNFIISRDSKFFVDNDSIKNFLDINNINEIFHLAKLKYFDTEMYKCCSKHRAFIQTIKNNEKHVGSAVINEHGIIGQVIHGDILSEVLLLTDSEHVLPIVSESHFCNARGSGKPQIIKCLYDTKVWQERVSIGQKFYSSGMGGIYPKDILIGTVQEIREIDENLIEFDINLVSNPLASNVVGILENIR
jgi:rod shape-determining protein MreC